MSSLESPAFHEVMFYTLQHADQAYFIHQYAVDAFTAQTANKETKPIALIFALAGLYLFLERGYSGRQVQLAHMHMAKNKQPWPQITLPSERGTITVETVLAQEPGPERDSMISRWCIEVWSTFQASHSTMAQLVTAYRLKI